MCKRALKIILLVLAGLFLARAEISAAQSIGEQGPVSTADLLAACRSIDVNRGDFCAGYVEGSVYEWRVAAACRSPLGDDQSFCSGSLAARKQIEKYRESFRQNNNPEEWRRFHKDMVQVIGSCVAKTPDREIYCRGFNLQLEIESIAAGSVYLIEPGDDARTRGIGQGASDFGVHLWAYQIMHFLVPCIPMDTGTESLIEVLISFARQYPELAATDTPTLLLAKAFYYGLCPGPRDGLLPHLEHCLSWQHEQRSLVTGNSCSKPVQIQFSTDGSQVIEAEIDPGELFDSKVFSRRYIFAACRPGYTSSVPFSPQNWETLKSSRYHCVER